MTAWIQENVSINCCASLKGAGSFWKVFQTCSSSRKGPVHSKRAKAQMRLARSSLLVTRNVRDEDYEVGSSN